MVHAATRDVLKHAEQHCWTRGSRLTEKRRQVLTGLLDCGRALSAYELIDFCREHQGIDLLPMSVYRILEFLESEGLVHRLNLVNKYVACSHIACDHKHEIPQFLICESCERVEEIGISRSLVASIAKTIEKAGYQLSNNQFELNCVCKACAARSKADP